MLQKIKQRRIKISEFIRLILPLMLLLALIVAVFQSQNQQSVNSHAQVASCVVSAADLAIDSEEQALLQLVNTYRQQHNLVPLKFSANLNRAAAWMSRDMATHNYLSHTDSNGLLPPTRLTNCGYNTLNVPNGENIAGNTTDANSTFTQWKNSPVHNANMLTGTFVVAGIARSYNANSTLKWYWVLDFGGQDDSTITPSQGPVPSNMPSMPMPSASFTPTPTQSNYCLGACVTPTPTPPTVSPSQVQPTDTPMPSGGGISTGPSIGISVAPSSTPGGKNNSPKLGVKKLLAFLLSIITLILELIRKIL